MQVFYLMCEYGGVVKCILDFESENYYTAILDAMKYKIRLNIPPSEMNHYWISEVCYGL